MNCCGWNEMYCCLCRYTTSPGSGGGIIRQKEVNGHFYCYGCFPKMVDVYVAELKLKEATEKK